MKVAARRALVIPALFLTIGINGLAQDKTSDERSARWPQTRLEERRRSGPEPGADCVPAKAAGVLRSQGAGGGADTP